MLLPGTDHNIKQLILRFGGSETGNNSKLNKKHSVRFRWQHETQIKSTSSHFVRRSNNGTRITRVKKKNEKSSKKTIRLNESKDNAKVEAKARLTVLMWILWFCCRVHPIFHVLFSTSIFIRQKREERPKKKPHELLLTDWLSLMYRISIRKLYFTFHERYMYMHCL